MNPAQMEKIHERMDAAIYGVPTAKAAIDIACYDVVGKALGIPVYDLLGGRYHDEFPITHVLSIGTPAHMAEEAEQRVQGRLPFIENESRHGRIGRCENESRLSANG